MIINLYHLVYSVISLGVAFLLIYVRFQRNLGHQKLGRGGLKFRIIILIALAALLLYPGDSLLSLFLFAFSPKGLPLCLAGLGIGISFAVRAAKHMRFKKQNDVLYYIPDTYVGTIVTTFFLSRIIYHAVYLTYYMLYMPSTYVNALSSSHFYPLFSIDQDLTTRFIFFITIGYYVYYYGYALHKSEKLKPEDWEKSDFDSVSSTDGRQQESVQSKSLNL